MTALTSVAAIRRRATEAMAFACRQADTHGLMGRASAGAVKRMAARLAWPGDYVYRDRRGYAVEADLSDHIERAGFFGAHSPRLLRCVAKLLAPGDWAVDVGANVGLVTSEMCAGVGPTGLVWAVEPLPRNVDRLTALKAANEISHLTVFPGALSSARATAMLRVPVSAGGSAYGSFVADWDSVELEVPTWRLDDLVSEHDTGGKRMALVKIDAEGAEPEVVAGAERTLRELRPLVLCEFNDVLLRLAGGSSQALLESFAELGYQPRPPFGLPARPLTGACVDILLAPSA